MENRSIGYKYYTFKLYFDENKVEIYDSSNNSLLKKATVVFDSEIERIIKEKDPNIVKFFDNILREFKLK